jgi:transglutaminase-like putative cysteine protease
MVKYHIEHTTRYKYERPIKQSVNQCIMKPFDDVTQKCLDYQLTISPETKYFTHTDYWGNEVYTFYLWDEYDELVVKSDAVVEVSSHFNQGHILSEEEHAAIQLTKSFQNEHAEFLSSTNFTRIPNAKLEAMTKPIWQQSKSLYDYVKNINDYIYEQFTYQSVSTTVETTAAEFLETKTGVCQDYAHLMLALCRYKGIPARYVSGYTYSGIDSKEMRGRAATHAWIEAALPGVGWVGFDPTNQLLAHVQHIRVAVGRDYQDIVPIKGVYKFRKSSVSHILDVEVQVQLL